MTKTLWKTALREIKRSPGRFFAILAIIMLGSGFFVGLKVTYNAMVRTGADFLADASFYDFAASSTIGYTEAEVAAIRADPAVLAAEGAVKVDALVAGLGEEDAVLSFLTFTHAVNQPSLTEGRAPLRADELVLDVRFSGALPLGSTLTLSEMNDPETLEKFAFREFTVVGYAASPLYLNYERGSTELGSGSVTAFVYADSIAFSVDYYTTVYIRTSSATAYSEDYDRETDAAEPAITALAEREAKERLEGLLADARRELREGEEAYQEAYAEYADQKSAAEAELAAAEEKLTAAKQELEDGRRQLEEGRQELEKRRAEGRAELNRAKRQLEAAKAELDAGEEAYAAGQEELRAGQAEYAAGLAQYTASRAARDSLLSLSRGSTELLNALAERPQGEEEGEETGEDTVGSLAERFYEAVEWSIREYYPDNRALTDALDSLSDAVSTYRALRKQWDEARESLSGILGLPALAVRLEESAIRLGSALRDFFTALTAQMTEA
ncbi:MAG: hypothetical protein ACSW8F_05725, partial [bacterium]